MIVHSFACGLKLLILSALPTLPAAPQIPAPPPSAAPMPRANEAAAVRMLRRIYFAQRIFQSAVDIDTNCDGIGEFGYFAELAGTKPMRVSDGCHPGAGSRSDVLREPLLPPEFGEFASHSFFARRLASYHGYYFQMWLPAQGAGGSVPGLSEDMGGGKTGPPFPGSVNGSLYWVCYAWPIQYEATGLDAFCINQRGVVLRYSNDSVVPFSGVIVMPPYDEAFERAGDMTSLRAWVAGGGWMSIWIPMP